MEVVIKFTESDLKDNLVLSTINNLFKQNKAITAPNFEFEDITPPQQQNSLKSNENNTEKSKRKTKEERVQDLRDYANSIYKDLSDAKKKSLKSFVAFYEKKIMQQDFNINYEKQFNNWWQNDKNNK